MAPIMAGTLPIMEDSERVEEDTLGEDIEAAELETGVDSVDVARADASPMEATAASEVATVATVAEAHGATTTTMEESSPKTTGIDKSTERTLLLIVIFTSKLQFKI